MPLYAESWPGSHVLQKNPGDLITAEWVVFNDGAETFAQLELSGLPHPTDVLLIKGPRTAVPAATPDTPGQATVRVTHVLHFALVGGGPHAIGLTMREVGAAGENIGAIRTHNWFLTILGGGGGDDDIVIVPVGEPVIT